ncbi:hypothetical protein ACH42_09030 [Endozoicomonas sp. (ex Bugula neritina AB1)]|nr:hypothetical protein ACH42_09030 [Endozoicomonas sp. (ex Bugula neritina AB1)]
MRRFIVVMLMWYSAYACSNQVPDKEFWIEWLAQLPEQGIEVSSRHWQILSKKPSPDQVQAIVQEYARYLDVGRLNKKYYQPGWTIPDTPTVMQTPLSPQMLKTLQPRIPQYKLLVNALDNLNHWRDTADTLFPDDLILFEGDQHSAVLQLNQWLEDLGLADDLPEDAYSQQHKDVLTDVQLLYDLSPDGRLGALTRQALLAVTNKRIRTLKANLERIRWLPQELPYPHTKVDIAGFNVAYVKSPSVTYIYKAIIGSARKQTPIFQHNVEGITVNPVWKVPHAIAAKSMLRTEKKEPGFFRKEGFKVYKSWDDNAPEIEPESVNWQVLNVRGFTYRLEQQPGPLNRLGKFKLNLPNSYGIYLHDTDKPELFDKKMRALSSGCTRVEGIENLIHLLAKNQGLAESVSSYLSSGTTKKLKFDVKIPIYFMYFTAWPDSEGRVRFRDDVYQLDNALTGWF